MAGRRPCYYIFDINPGLVAVVNKPGRAISSAGRDPLTSFINARATLLSPQNVFKLMSQKALNDKVLTDYQVLTKREIVILRMLLNGLTIHRIADILDLAVKSVYGYERNITIKLGVRKFHHVPAILKRWEGYMRQLNIV